MSAIPNHNWDVIVVGAGITGLSAALVCQQQGYRVAVLERQAASEPDLSSLDRRIYALTPGNIHLLQSLSVWQSMDASRYCPVEQMQVWAEGQAQALTFNAFEAGLSDLGHIVESQQLVHALLQQLAARDIPVFYTSHISALAQDGDHAVLTVNQQAMHAKLLIAADGVQSSLRDLANIAVHKHVYAQQALVANFACELAHHHTARQWFFDQDILAFLPLPQQSISIVWSTQQAQALSQLEPHQLAQRVAQAGHGLLGELTCLSAPAIFPLAKQSAQQTVQARLVLIGDAAHSIHPMAGQGVNLGLRDVAALGQYLQKAPRDIGDYLFLRQYERARSQDVLSVQALTHGLYHVFNQPSAWVKQMAAWGLQLPNRLPAVKKQLIKQAIR